MSRAKLGSAILTGRPVSDVNAEKLASEKVSDHLLNAHIHGTRI